MNTRPSSIEALEARIAPALMLANPLGVSISEEAAAGAVAQLFEISADGKTATYTDFDGDVVSLTVSRGRLKPANFLVTTESATGRVEINLLDISAAKFGQKFQGTNITVSTADPAAFADLAAINARGIDIGRVIVDSGDLGQIDAGDFDLGTPGVNFIRAAQMGFHGSAGQIAGQDTVSKIRGPVGGIQVVEFKNAFIDVKGGISVIALGSIDATEESTNGNGTIRASGAIGSVFVDGDIEGGAGDFSGDIWSRTKIGSITVTGSLKGGAGFDSGAIFAASPDNSNFAAGKKIGPVTVLGSIVGGAGTNSATLFGESGVRTVTVGGDVIGGSGDTSGSIVSGRGFAAISIAGNLTSGSGPASGSIIAIDGDAPSIAIGRQIRAGNFADSGIFVNGFLGTLSFQSAPGGTGNATEIRALFGIGSLNVFGDMNDVFVRAGANTAGLSATANATIGTVVINGNFSGGGLSAGGDVGPDGFTFTADDVLFAPDSFPTFLSTIDAVFVGGTFTPLAVEAESLGTIIVAGVPLALQPGAHNDNFIFGATTVIKEIA